jgi:hypothetical protein
MKLADIKAAFEGADDEKKASAWKAIAAAMASSEGDSDEEKKDEPAAEKKDAAEEPEKKDAKKAGGEEPEKKDGADEPEKKDTASVAATVLASQDARIRELEARLAKSDKRDEDSERKSVIAAREMSAELAKTLASKPLAFVKDICSALPAKVPSNSSTESIQATRGAGNGGVGLPADERAKLAERMGLTSVKATISNVGNKQIFPTMTADEARAFVKASSDAKKGGN